MYNIYINLLMIIIENYIYKVVLHKFQNYYRLHNATVQNTKCINICILILGNKKVSFFSFSFTGEYYKSYLNVLALVWIILTKEVNVHQCEFYWRACRTLCKVFTFSRVFVCNNTTSRYCNVYCNKFYQWLV